MKRIKNLDYFRKTEHEKATRSGGIISLLCFAVCSLTLHLGNFLLSIHIIPDLPAPSSKKRHHRGGRYVYRPICKLGNGNSVTFSSMPG